MSALPQGAENRKSKRLRALLRAQVQGMGVAVRNISSGGMQVACSAMFFDFLKPALRSSTVALEMPLSGQTVRLQATPVYVNKHGDDFLIGLQLTNDRTEDWHSFQTFVRYVESEND